jgi:hypothetical protein
LQQPAAHVADERVDEAHEAEADAAALHDQSRENEEGQRQQDEIAGAVHHGLRQRHDRGGVSHPQIRRGGEQQPEADRHAGEDRDKEQDQRRCDGVVARNPRLPPRIGQPKHRDKGREQAAGHQRRRVMLAAKPLAGVESEQRHRDRQRERDHGRRDLQDRCHLYPIHLDEDDRGDHGHCGNKEHQQVREREADAMQAERKRVEHGTDEAVVAAAVGHGAADEGECRERDPGHLLGPQERRVEEGAGQDVGEDGAELAEERDDQHDMGE